MRTSLMMRLCVLLFSIVSEVRGATVMIDGAGTNQVIEGFGVNANHRGWNGDELVPVLDRLIDEGGMTLFRVIYDNTDWEATNDNADVNVINWDYYDPIYTNADFSKLWDLMGYLNQRGITNGAILSFMGYGPGWLCGSTDPNNQVLTPGLEGEWAEMIASAVIYARNARGLKFRLVSPNNESDIWREGIHLSGGTQYVTTLHKLAEQLDANDLGDVRLLGPEYASTDTETMGLMMGDALVMSKVQHFTTHGYAAGAGSGGVASFIRNSAYPDRTFWQTEFNVWCSTCDSGTRGNYDWSYCRGTAEYLLSHLANGAAAALVYEGYDSYYAHHGAWGFWGLFAVDDENAAVKTYTPRKNFYTVAQVSKWVRPGAQRIDLSGSTAPFSPLLAFKHPGLGQVTIVGVNTSGSAATLDGTLTAVPALTRMELYYTSATTNLASGGEVPVNEGSFSATIPADCVFTLTGAAAVSIALTSPTSNAQYSAPAVISLEASAATTTGNVTQVEFYSGTNELGVVTAAPYQLTWSEVPMGDYGLWAVAGDSAGNFATSGVVQVAVSGDLSQVVVSPVSADVMVGGMQLFSVAGKDELGHVLVPPPVVIWSVSGGGTMNSNGVFTAGGVTGGPFMVQAVSGSITGVATVRVSAVSSNRGGTIGNTTEGNLTDTLWDGGAYINAGRFLAQSNMAVTTMFAKVVAISGNYKCAIYADNSSQPGRLLGLTAEVSNAASGWATFPLTSTVSLTNGAYYWLAIWSDDPDAQIYYSNTAGTLRSGRHDYGAWPDPLITTDGSELDYCIQAVGSATTPLFVATTSLPPGVVGVSYSAQLSAVGGIAPYTWSLITNATTPTWLTLLADGQLSFIPQTEGQFTLSILVSDATSMTASQDTSLRIQPLRLTLGATPQTAQEITSMGFKLTISANAPGMYEVQRSSDFTNWQVVQRVSVTNDPVPVMDTNVIGSSSWFYRARKD